MTDTSGPEDDARCRACGGPLRVGDAFCPACGTRVGRAQPTLDDATLDEGGFDELAAALEDVAEPVAMPREIPADDELPRGLSVAREGGGLRMVNRWFHPAHIGVVLFAVLWDTFMVVWYGIALTGGIWEMALFGTLHGLVGAVLAYWAVAGLVNHTTVWLRSGRLEVRHAPMWWPGGRRLDAHQVDQLFVTQVEHHSRSGTRVTYNLHAQLLDGSSLKLMGGAHDAAHVKAIEAVVEGELGLVDRPVPGEFS